MAFFFDQTRCLSCNVCTIGCKDWNQVNPGPVRWRTAKTYETNSSPYFHPLAMSCNHCKEPACLAACSVNAISKRDDGIVYVDRDKCIGLQACIGACPFAKPKIADDQQEPNMYVGWQIAHPMQKCDFCQDRLGTGMKPICVESCPVFALDIDDYDVLLTKYPDAVQINAADFPYAYINNTNDTGPSYLIRKRGPMKITEDIG